MTLDDSILEALNQKVDELNANETTMYSVLNNLKDIYVGIIENGYIPNDAYLNLAAYVLYAGYLMDD